MRSPNPRSARARDYVLTGVGTACLVLAVIFVAGRIWFRALFAAALNGEPLVWAGGFLCVAAVLGVLYSLSPPPLSESDRQAYKGCE